MAPLWNKKLVAIVLALGAGAVVGGLLSFWRLQREPERSMTPTPTSVNSTQPTILAVTCTSRRVELTSPSVRPQPDGVHLLVQKDTAQTVGVIVDYAQGRSWIHGTFAGRGNLIAPTGSHMVWVLPPGHARIVCEFEDTKGTYAEFDIIDSDNLYVSPDLACSTATSYEVFLPLRLALAADRVDAVRHAMHGLRDSDQIEAAGYPNQDDPILRVVRDGRTIARIDFGPVRSSSITTCSGSGISA